MKFESIVNYIFSIRICTFYMQKLSTAAGVAAAEKFTEKWRNFVN
jgi:hypothetical protein